MELKSIDKFKYYIKDHGEKMYFNLLDSKAFYARWIPRYEVVSGDDILSIADLLPFEFYTRTSTLVVACALDDNWVFSLYKSGQLKNTDFNDSDLVQLKQRLQTFK